MGGNAPPFWHSARFFLQNYVDHFTDTNTYHVLSILTAIVFAGVLGFLSDLLYQVVVIAVWLVIFLVGLYQVYRTGRPFGINVSCTPTHLVNGDREPDKSSEQRGNILIQNNSTKIHGQVELTRFNNSFDIYFDSSSEINVELETVPRREHSYDPERSRLSCRNVSDYQFPIKLVIYPMDTVERAGRYHSLMIRDGNTDRVISEFEVIDVRS